MLLELTWKSWQLVVVILLLLPVFGAFVLWVKKKSYWPWLVSLAVAFVLVIPLQYSAFTWLRVAQLITGPELQELAGTAHKVSFYPASQDDFVVGVDVINSYRRETSFNPPWPSKEDVEITIDNNLNPRHEQLYTYFNLNEDSWSYFTLAAFQKPWESTRVTYNFKTIPPPSIDSVMLTVKRVVETEGDLGFVLVHGFSLLMVYGTLLISLAITSGYKLWNKSKND